MANAIHQKTLVTRASLAVTSWNSLADGDIAWVAPITTCDTAEFVDFCAQITIGTSPDAGGTVEFYAGGGDGGSLRVGTNDIDASVAGSETTDADVARVLGVLGLPFAVITCDGASGVIYTVRGRLWFPGPVSQVFCYNNSGAALPSSGHSATITGRGPEVQ